MSLNRRLEMLIVIGMLAMLVGQSAPARAQGDDIALRIYRLARTLYYDDLLHNNVTYWADGDLGSDPAVRSGDMIKRPLPDFTLALLNGTGQVSNSDMQAPYLINFWASWCPACRQEFPLLIESIQEGTLDIPILFVDVSDTKASAQRYIRSLALPDDVTVAVEDAQSVLSIRLGVDSIPQTFLIDARGTIQAIRVGEINDPALRFLTEIARHPGVGTFDANAPSHAPDGSP
jgi:cytochrome c biogenesis protein CcmG/thiol:disulfide interchange protein DsbE